MAELCTVCGDELCLTHCVYCGVDCTEDEPEHAADCPATTGLFPVEYVPPQPATITPGRCCRCETEFKLGDFYARIEVEVEDSPLPVYESVCAGCAVLAQEGRAA